MLIESLQNDKIKELVKLMNDNRYRRKKGCFTVEGLQENERASKFYSEANEYYICENIFSGNIPKGKIHYVSEKVYTKIAYRGTTEGIIGIYNVKNQDLSEFLPEENATIIVVEGIEKPGNLGAVLRSCEAFGVNALIITESKTDFYNPNVIRSSVGCLFGMNIFQTGNEETYSFLKKHGFRIYTTFMDESTEAVQNQNLRQKSALLFGTEHSGLSSFWLNKGKNTLIPMTGSIDSLNLSNAVAIGCYEAVRQKMI